MNLWLSPLVHPNYISCTNPSLITCFTIYEINKLEIIADNILFHMHILLPIGISEACGRVGRSIIAARLVVAHLLLLNLQDSYGPDPGSVRTTVRVLKVKKLTSAVAF